MNMSFISHASPHEVLSFFTQSIHPWAKDWLTVDVIQSAIMTSSLINLTLANPAYSLAHAHTCTLTAVSVISRCFFWDHGKVFCHINGVTLGMAVLVGLPSTRWSRVKLNYLNSYWMDSHSILYWQSWVIEDYQQDGLPKKQPIFTAIAALDSAAMSLLVAL